MNLAVTSVVKEANCLQLNQIYTEDDELSTLKTEGLITRCRTLVWQVRSSPAQKADFAAMTHWSYTYSMLKRLVLLRNVVDKFTWKHSINGLHKADWAVIDDLLLILQLSSKRTWSLCRVLPSFETVILEWRKLNAEMEHLQDMDRIQAGIEKLLEYQELAELVPVYVIGNPIVLNPKIELKWLERLGGAAAVEKAIEVFVKAVAEALSYLGDVDAALDTYPAILTYWQCNGAQWPQILLVAYDVLPACGSSVPCPQLMEASQILKYGLKNEDRLDFTGYLNTKVMLEEMEVLNVKEDKLPEEISTKDYITLFGPLGERPQRGQGLSTQAAAMSQ
ncbi:hypothetical protein AAF712_014170 [Marasmius tenuissimus]|uniref:Uncharacterized protein n=1 Tax=Marasmius tenuissimus TaxID=585030 RepID=A0ABR2ZBU2_9AGAR